MKAKKFLAEVLILSGLLITVNRSHACSVNQIPYAALMVREYVIVGRNVIFDGSLSYDPDGSLGIGINGIVKFEWDFGDGHYYAETAGVAPDGVFDGIATHKYNKPGIYQVMLKVTDFEGATGCLGSPHAVNAGLDSDNDDMPDNWENVYGLSVGTDDAEGDAETVVDGYYNLREYLYGSDPTYHNVGLDNITICVPDEAMFIQRAINVSVDGDTIVVSEGTYTGNGNRDILLAGSTNTLTIRSTDPENPTVVAATIIDCQGTSGEKHRAFYFSGGNSSTITGFTITNGYHGSDAVWGGGGIYCDNSSPTITNCAFTNNISSKWGGGIIIVGGSSPLIKNCIFSKNQADKTGGGIHIYLSSATVVNCVFNQNESKRDEYSHYSGGGGLDIYRPCSTVTVTNCIFSQNHTTGYGGGMCCYNVNQPSIYSIVTNCTFYGNITSGLPNDDHWKGGGLYCNNYARATIKNCIFWQNQDKDGIDESAQIDYQYVQPQIDYSCVEGWTGNLIGNGNTGEEPHFIDVENPAGPDDIFATSDDGLSLYNASPYDYCLDRGDNTAVPPGTDIVGNPRTADGDHDTTPTVDMGAYETVPVWYVDDDVSSGQGKSWTDAFQYLQDALARASAGEEIWVAEGTYYPDRGTQVTLGDRGAKFQLKNGVATYGGFAGKEYIRFQRDWTACATILSGDIGTPVQSDNSYHVVWAYDIDNCILDGFTIKGGNANHGFSVDKWGGGIYCESSTPTISNCIITGNTSISKGAGIFCYNASVEISNCIINDNICGELGGGMYTCNSHFPVSQVVTNCSFRGNRAAYGGGVYNVLSSVTFTNCTFEENQVVSGNDSEYKGGGMYNYNSSPTLANCVFTNNIADTGAGMYNYYSYPFLTVINCIFAGNKAIQYRGGCGGMFNNASSPLVVNCTFNGNVIGYDWYVSGCVGSMFNVNNSSPTVVNCIFWGVPDEETCEIFSNLPESNAIFSNCDIRGCVGSGDGWNDYVGIDGGGNLDIDPHFIDADDPAGPDGLFGTDDDGLRLSVFDPRHGNLHMLFGGSCLDSADNSAAPLTDIVGRSRVDIPYLPNSSSTSFTDMGAYESPCVWYVKSNGGRGKGWSWNFALEDLQDAIETARPGDEIWVAAGTYKPSKQTHFGQLRSATFLLDKPIAIYGGFSGTEYARHKRNWVTNETILSGDIGEVGTFNLGGIDPDNCYHVMMIKCDDVIVDGVTIADGYEDYSTEPDFDDVENRDRGNGGGIFTDSSSFTLKNCVIRDNYAYYYGGGMCVYKGAPNVTDCTFMRNEAYGNPENRGWGAGMCSVEAFPVVTDCIFSSNTEKENGECYGGGLCNYNSSAVIANCIFNRNSALGGGICNRNSEAVITNCGFRENANLSGDGGGIYNLFEPLEDGYEGYPPSFVLANCFFSGNVAKYNGGAIYIGSEGATHNDAAELTLNNCTFVWNRTRNGYNGGAVYFDCDILLITNCIFWQNGPGYQIFADNGTVEVGNCFVNIEADINPQATRVNNGGNISGDDPDFVNTPEFYDETIGGGWNDAIVVKDAGKYSIGDTIQYGDDTPGKSRIVIKIFYDEGFVAFAPPLDDPSTESVPITNWGKYAVTEAVLAQSPSLEWYVDYCKIKNLIGRLKPDTSPCIDTGLDEGVTLDVTDLDDDGRTFYERTPYDIMGVPRFQKLTEYSDSVDMGAFESGGLIAADISITSLDEDTDYPIELTNEGVQDLKRGPFTYEIITKPKHGTVTPSDGENDTGLVYEPYPNYYDGLGDDTGDFFYYKTFDGINYSEIAKVTIGSIDSANDDPVAVEDLALINPEQESILIDVLGNDSDVDGDELCNIQVKGPGPEHGTAVPENDKVRYTPEYPESPQEDSFYYSMQDQHGNPSNDAQVTVQVNSRPLAVDDPEEPAGPFVTKPNIIAVINVLNNDSDPDGHSFAIKQYTQPSIGKVVPYDKNPGVLLYIPDSKESTPYVTSFPYKLEDKHGLESESEAIVRIKVDDSAAIDDFDRDMICDDDEENLFYTDPNKSDSDDDGVYDGEEIISGFHPLNPSWSGHYADPLPYIACFQTNQGYVPRIWDDQLGVWVYQPLDGQLGWKVGEGGNCEILYETICYALPDDDPSNPPFEPSGPQWGCMYAHLHAGISTISKEFKDNGEDDDYSNIIRIKLYPTDNACVKVLTDDTASDAIITGVKFVPFEGIAQWQEHGGTILPNYDYPVGTRVRYGDLNQSQVYECVIQGGSGTNKPSTLYSYNWVLIGAGEIYYWDPSISIPDWVNSGKIWKKYDRVSWCVEGADEFREHHYAMVLKFEFNFDKASGDNEFKIFWDAEPEPGDADEDDMYLRHPADIVFNTGTFSNSIKTISKIEFTSGETEDFDVRGLYINSVEEIGTCAIKNPSTGDQVQESRIPVKGWACSVNMSEYEIKWFLPDYDDEPGYDYSEVCYKSAKLVNGNDEQWKQKPLGEDYVLGAMVTYEPDNTLYICKQKVGSGSNPPPDTGGSNQWWEETNYNALGYWNTGMLPKGIYHVAVGLCDDLCKYESLTPLYGAVSEHCAAGVSYIASSGTVKNSTFRYVEEPDISVPWPGEFPFELRRIYDSGRQHIISPFYPGWTNNNQIILIENADYYESPLDDPSGKTAKGNQAHEDASGLAFGAIYVQYEDGTMHLFRHKTGSIAANVATYVPYPDDGSGDYIIRTTTGSVPEIVMTDCDYPQVEEAVPYDPWPVVLNGNNLEVTYELYHPDGTKIVFHSIVHPEVVKVPDDIVYRLYDEDDPPNYDELPYYPYGGTVYKKIRFYYDLPWRQLECDLEQTRYYMEPGEKWRFVTAAKTKSDRFGNTLYFKWDGDQEVPGVNEIHYDYNGDCGGNIDGDNTKISIVFSGKDLIGYTIAKLIVNDVEKRHVNFYFTLTKHLYDASNWWPAYVLEVSKGEPADYDEALRPFGDASRDFTVYEYYGTNGYLVGIYKDELGNRSFYEGYYYYLTPWSAWSTGVFYDWLGEFETRIDFVDEDTYQICDNWYFFFEPDSGNELDGQCVFTAVDYYDSTYSTYIPYREDFTIINEIGQLRAKCSSGSGTLGKVFCYDYYNDSGSEFYELPFTPKKIREYWHEYDYETNDIIEAGRIIVNEHEVTTHQPGDSETDAKCYNLTNQSIYYMEYEDGYIIDDKTVVAARILSCTEADYHDYPGYNFLTKKTSYQELDKEHEEDPQHAKPVKTEYIYGKCNGDTPWPDDPYDESDKYLVMERVLLNDKGTPDIGDDDWAETKYIYYSDYPKKGLLQTKTDPEENITHYYYDGYNYKQWIKVEQDIGGSPVEVPVERYYHDEIGQMRLKADTKGLVTLYDYDDYGNVAKVRTYHDPVALDENERPSFTPEWYQLNGVLRSTTIYGYDERCRRNYEKTFSQETWENQVPPPSSPEDVEAAVKMTMYTLSDKPNFVLFFENQTKYNDYITDGEASYDSFVENIYNGHDQKLVEMKYDLTAEPQRQWWCRDYYYDSMDRLYATISYDYENRATLRLDRCLYHGSGKKAFDEIWGCDSQGWWEPQGRIDYKYDELDRLKERAVVYDVDADNLLLRAITRYDYDDTGNCTGIKDPRDNCIFFDYDNANRKVKEYFAVPFNSSFETTKNSALPKTYTEYYKNDLVKDTYSYNYNGSLGPPLIPGTLLAHSKFEYDERSRVEQVTEYVESSPDVLAETTYEYEDSSNSTWSGYEDYANVTITRKNDTPPDNVTRIAYNEQGKTIAVQHPHDSGGTKPEKLQYNGDGTINARNVWDGSAEKLVEYDYDTFGRLKQIIYPDSSPQGTVTYSYDGFGRKIQLVDGRNADDKIGGTWEYANKISYEYDPLDRIISVTDQDGYIINYSYRSDGQKTAISVTHPPNPEYVIYDVDYDYDLAGRLKNVAEPLLSYGYQAIAGFDYDENGNRSQLKYYLNGSASGPAVSIDYTYNLDNMLTKYKTTGGCSFEFGKYNGTALEYATIDGLGRLRYAEEKITNTSQVAISHNHTYDYDMRSQLTNASITNINSGTWTAVYNYRKDGNLNSRTIGSTTTFTYNGDLMDIASGGEIFDLGWDDNGNMTTGVSATTLTYNWDNKLRHGQCGTKTIDLKYDPDGNRIWKQSTVSGQTTTCKYIVDIVGDLPVILMELDPQNNMAIKKTYIYANGQILCQHNGDHTASRYFYLHDRLGSVRQVIDTSGNVKNCYTYQPFGELFATETTENMPNPFKFTGQYYDSEISEYYLRARQYDPHIGRFTTRDPVAGKFEEPLSLHRYLYCGSDPVNRIDLIGLLYTPAGGPSYGWRQTQQIISYATNWIAERGLIGGPFQAFGPFGTDYRGEFDYKYYKGDPARYSFEIQTLGKGNGLLGSGLGYEYLQGSEFTNYLSGYTLYYNFGAIGELGDRFMGHGYAYGSYVIGEGEKPYDEAASRYWISRGVLDANLTAQRWYEKYGSGAWDKIDQKSYEWDEIRIRFFLNIHEAMYFSDLHGN